MLGISDFRSETLEERPIRNSVGDHLQAKSMTMVPIIRLRDLRPGLQPKPQLSSVERTRSTQVLFAAATP